MNTRQCRITFLIRVGIVQVAGEEHRQRQSEEHRQWQTNDVLFLLAHVETVQTPEGFPICSAGF